MNLLLDSYKIVCGVFRYIHLSFCIMSVLSVILLLLPLTAHVFTSVNIYFFSFLCIVFPSPFTLSSFLSSNVFSFFPRFSAP